MVEGNNKIEKTPFVPDSDQYSQPDWKPGHGAQDQEWKKHKKIEIDPYGEGRNPFDNYRLLTSAVVPRPIGFISTISKDGHRNLAPFSYFNVVNSEPPVFCLGITLRGRKDTEINILETGELTINIISEWFVDAANYTSIDGPSTLDEWKASGLTPVSSTVVKPPHVAESAFSVEAKLLHHYKIDSKLRSEKSGTVILAEGLKFHAREDIINEEKNGLDIAKFKPVGRLAGNNYVPVTTSFSIGRPVYAEESSSEEYKALNAED